MPKRYYLRKYTCLDYIKLHGVHDNSSNTVAGLEACPLHLQADPKFDTCVLHFRGCFPSSTNSRKASWQLMVKQFGR